jgi:hypothetical protein
MKKSGEWVSDMGDAYKPSNLTAHVKKAACLFESSAKTTQ